MQRRDPYQPALDKAQRDLSALDPFVSALHSGAEVHHRPEGQVLKLAYWGHALEVAWPAGEVRLAAGGATGVPLLCRSSTAAEWGIPATPRGPHEAQRLVGSPAAGPLSTTVRLIVLHYLVTADGTPLADRWLSFRELPDGRVYDAAFRKRAQQPLARVFGERPESFVAAGQRLGGQRLTFGDVSFMFQVLPRVRVATVLYARDEEFPAEATMLFDASLRHYLPIEDVAVLGGLVAGELLRAR